MAVIDLDRDAAIARWRRAESLIYPTVMVNATLYEEYVTAVRAVAELLADVHTEDDLVVAFGERRDVAREALARLAPTMAPVMDTESLRAAAFCHRHRQITREHDKELARQRLDAGRMSGAEWVLLFEDVTPLGSQALEMHVRSGRAIRSAANLPLDGTHPSFELEVVQLDPRDGAWLIDKPPLVPLRRFDRRDEWEARIAQARTQFGRE
ncbi:MAG: hypothetical protein ABR569_08825 [Gaiellaceae bacterium]